MSIFGHAAALMVIKELDKLRDDREDYGTPDEVLLIECIKTQLQQDQYIKDKGGEDVDKKEVMNRFNT